MDSDLTSDMGMSKKDNDGKIAREEKALKKEAERSLPVVMRVEDIAHAKSPEVIQFCVRQLQKGMTWNELRHSLGLGHAGIDRRWRVIKEIICSSVMPENEEEALKASYSLANYTMDQVEKFLDRVQRRSAACEGEENEAQMLKVELETMKLQLDAAEKRFEHYARMKELVKEDKKNQGASIIVQNNYYIPRPGDDIREARDVARKLINTAALEKKDE